MGQVLGSDYFMSLPDMLFLRGGVLVRRVGW